MSHVLRTFHPEAKLPEKEEELRAQYLSVLHNKRALLLMDNAKDAAQVKPLIPPEGCALLVTSRQHFALPGLEAKNLETLPPPDAKDFLLRIAPRIKGEADNIAKLCGYLPQALRLAASAIAVRVNLEPQDYAKQLADEKKRLELLAGDDESVAASINLSYSLLDAEAQKRWRMLAVFPDTFDIPGASTVWEIEPDAARETLSSLLRYSMLEWNDSTKRYRMHDLMRDFARGKLSTAELDDAGLRHSKRFLSVIGTANESYAEGGESLMRGLALFDLEWGNIQAGQEWAAKGAEHDSRAAEFCSGYPARGAYVLSLRQHPWESIRWSGGGLAAARRLKNRAAEGGHLGDLSNAYRWLGDNRRSIDCCERALAIFREAGDRQREASCLGNLGIAYKNLGEYRRAVEYHEQALAIAREIGAQRNECKAIGNLGIAHCRLGEYERAIECQKQHLILARKIGDRTEEGGALGGLGICYGSLADHGRAVGYFEQALAIAREIGDRRGEAQELGNLGLAYANLGESGRAIEYHNDALAIARDIGDRTTEGNELWSMSRALHALGDRKKAVSHAELAITIFEQIEHPDTAMLRKQLELWRNG